MKATIGKSGRFDVIFQAIICLIVFVVALIKAKLFLLSLKIGADAF